MEGEEEGDDMTEDEEDGDDEEEVWFSRRIRGLLSEGPASVSPYLKIDYEEMNHGRRIKFLTTKSTSNIQRVLRHVL